MYNIATYQPKHSPRIEEENRIKGEWQKDMAVVDLMKIKAPPNSLIGLERDQNLRIMDYNEKEIEELTGYKQTTEPLLSAQTSEANQIRSMGRDIWEKMKAYELKVEEEFELEYDRLLRNGIRLGFIEEEVGSEPKL